MQAIPALYQRSPVKVQPLQSLTGLRFFAAFFVFLSHFYIFNYFAGITGGTTYDLLVQSGWMGVSFFFVLSGFVLFINYCHPTGKTFNLKSFYVNRFARIYPVFALTTLFALPIELLSPERKAVWMPLLANLLMLQCFHSSTCGTLNQPAWSIGSEFTFYLLFPMLSLLFIAKPLKPKLLLTFLFYFCYLGLMVLLLSNDFYARASFPFNRVGEFLLGMTAGWFFLTFEQHPRSQFLTNIPCLPMGMMAGAGLLLLIMFFQPLVLESFSGFQQIFYLFYALPATGIILIFAFLERAGKLPMMFLHPWLLLGGEISYSFYLLHHLVIRYTKHLLGFVFHLSVEQTYSWAIGGGITLFMLLVSLGGAYVLYRLIEKPMRQKIIQRFSPPT